MKKTIYAWILAMTALSSNSQDNNGRYYSAGEIQSKAQVQFGRFEFRMYSSDMSGTTSTFFLWKEGSTQANVQWNEIDVETFGKSANSWQSNPIWEYETNDFNPRRWEAFHNAIPIANRWVTFTVEWTPNYIAWYNNGTQVRRILKGQNAPQGLDPVGNITDAMRMCFNHWATYPGNWLGPFNAADLPSFQFVDWFTYQRWNGNGFDAVSIRNDFNNLTEVTTNYNISTHTFGDNQCTFRAANVGVLNGMLWLSITGYNNARPPAGSEIPNPGTTTPNTPPTVSITAPTSGAGFASGSTITLTANASDVAPGNVTSVSFYDGTTLLGTDVTSPYSYTWIGAGAGTHSITARATDNNGAITTSAAVSVTVNAASNPLTGSYFHIVNKFTADYMRPTAGSPTATIIQEAATTAPTFSSFQWEFRAAPTAGYYFIVNRYTGNAIQPTGGSIADNMDLSQVTLSGTNQSNTELHWVLQASDEAPFYWIRNRKSGLYIRPAGGANGTGIEIVQNTLNTTYSSFKWNLLNQVAIPSASHAPENGFLIAADAADTNDFTIAPNPAEGLIYVSTEVGKMTTVTINIYNMSGVLAISKAYKSRVGWFRESIDISCVASGTYILELKKGTKSASKKLIRK